MKVNTLTGVHVLRYLLAETGLEPPYQSPAAAWPLYAQFLRIASESGSDKGIVTVGPIDEAAGIGVEILLSRRLADQAPGYQLTREISLAFTWELPATVLTDKLELNSQDFATIEEFLDACEAAGSSSGLWERLPDWADVIEEDDSSISDSGD